MKPEKMKAKIELYHAATEIISKPLCGMGRRDLDFGPGFYMTDIYDQAVMWANRRANERKLPAILNVYILDMENMLNEARVKIFENYDKDWLNFIVACRKGKHVWEEYDYIEGGIANDRVIDTVNLFINGLMSEEVAIRRLRYMRPNNQICILNQGILDRHLIFNEAIKLSD
mgnify:CR=1 FL=1